MPAPVTHLTGVYHAEGNVLGELRYLVGRQLGRTHCALCDVTHGRLREKRSWREAREAIGVPFKAVHLDERTPAEREASEGRTPCVLAHTADGVQVLLDREALERCDGDPERLVAALRGALSAGAEAARSAR